MSTTLRVYVGVVIPAGSYEDFDEEVGTIGVPNFLLANESLDEELAYQVTRVLFEQQAALAEAHPKPRSSIWRAPET